MIKTTFEEKLAHSNALLERLRTPDMSLEESVKLYEEGLSSIKDAQRLIEEAEIKISIIEQNSQTVEEK
ncbi:MAG: exodeoxyribonuclease VII small subunit [Sulfurovum sp.]